MRFGLSTAVAYSASVRPSVGASVHSLEAPAIHACVFFSLANERTNERTNEGTSELEKEGGREPLVATLPS